MGSNQTVPTPAIEINVHKDMAARRYADIKIKKQKLKEKRQMLKDAFQQDAEYHDKESEVNDKKKELAAIKERVGQSDAIVKLKMEIQDMTVDLKEEQMSLFADLEAYTRTTNMNTIEIEGAVKIIVKEFKIKNEERS